VTTPTGPAAGVHLPWAEVPAAVRTWAAGVGGGAPGSVHDRPGGFSPGATAVLACPGGTIFVKAVGGGLNPESPAFHRREAVISASLPEAPEFPRLLDIYDDGDWVALAFEAIDGRPPAHPWDEGELRAAVHALDALHDALTPNPVPDAPPAAERLQSLFGGWAELASESQPPAGLDDWSGRNLPRLAELESGWPDAVAGPTLLHGDVRSDNLLVTGSGVVFVDWAPEALLTLSRSAAAIDPARLAVLVAALSGFLVRHSLYPPPPGLPTLRPFQAAQGAVALDWLRRATGW
jgi:Phosphotransferase enzyme family